MQNEDTITKKKAGGMYVIDENYRYTLLTNEKSKMSMRHSSQDSAQTSYLTVTK